MKKNPLGLLAFAVLLINSIVYVLGVFDIGGTILPFISEILLIIVVLGTAWLYVKGLDKGWQTVYFIIAVIIIASFVLGKSTLF